MEREKTPPKRPFVTKNFKWACWLTAFFLAIYLIVLFYDSTDGLYRATFQEEPTPSTDCKERHYFFVKENCFSDSAVWYNNKGVDAYWDAFGQNGPNYNAQNAVIFND